MSLRELAMLGCHVVQVKVHDGMLLATNEHIHNAGVGLIKGGLNVVVGVTMVCSALLKSPRPPNGTNLC